MSGEGAHSATAMRSTALAVERISICGQIVHAGADARGRFRFAHVLQEHLQIVQPAKQLLHPFEQTELCRDLAAARLGVEFQAVAKLLQRNPGPMQPFR